MMKTILVLAIFVTTSTYGNPISMDERTFTEEGENIFLRNAGYYDWQRIQRDKSTTDPQGSNGVVDMMVNVMSQGLKMSEGNLKKIKKFLGEIDEMKNRVDKKIKDITTEIGVVNAGEIKHTKLALDAYRSVKSTLRRQRFKLTKLADKTVRVTDDLLLYLEAWGPDYSGEEKKSYLKIQMDILQKLIEESKVVLEEAKKEYAAAIDKVDEVDGHLTGFSNAINRLLSNSTDEHAILENKVENAAIGGTLILVGTVIADIFGCLGACTAVAITAGGAAGAGLASSLSEAEARLSQLENVVSRADDDIKLIREDTNNLMNFIKEEITLISSWQNAIDVLESKMEYAGDEDFLKLKLHRKSFEKALQGLHKAATDFLNVPTDIFENDFFVKFLVF